MSDQSITDSLNAFADTLNDGAAVDATQCCRERECAASCARLRRGAHSRAGQALR